MSGCNTAGAPAFGNMAERMEPAELEALIRRAQRREPDALGRLAEHFGPRLHGFLVRMCGSGDVADDLLQETFVRLVRTIDSYQHDARFAAWLYRIATNLAHDHRRRIRRRGATLSLDAAPGERDRGDAERFEWGPVDAGGPSPDAGAIAGEQQARLAAAMDELSEMDREILLLRHFSELPFAEIAALLEIPLGTALARAHRALARLRGALEGDPPRWQAG